MRLLTVENWQLLDLLNELLLDVHGVGVLVLEVLGGHPARLLSQVLTNVPPVVVVPLQHMDLLALDQVHRLACKSHVSLTM